MDLLDPKDFQLLVALHDNARQSYQSLGRKVSLSAPSVRGRLERLKRKGILQGFMLAINPDVFDRVGILLFFRGNFQPKAAAGTLAAPDVSWIVLKLDGQMVVGIWTKDEAGCINHLTDILGTKPLVRALLPYKKSTDVSGIDLSIMDALVDDPKLSFGKLVESVGLSPKTVRKHLDSLLETKTISIAPHLGSLADSGELVYHLVVAGSVSMGEVRRIMGETALLQQIEEPPMKYVLCRGTSLIDMTDKIRTLEKVQGVESAALSLNRKTLVSTALRHNLIKEEIRKLRERQVPMHEPLSAR